MFRFHGDCFLLSLLVFLTLPVGDQTVTARTPWQRYEFSQPHMGTTFRLVLYAADLPTAEKASQKAFARIAQLDGIMSDYRETSELMLLCRQAGKGPVKVSPDLFRIIERSHYFSILSAGAFEITAGPVIKLWRRARRTEQLPDNARLREALSLTGDHLMRLDQKAQTVSLEKAGMQLDLGGIAKGYAADAVIEILKGEGINRALVAAGGDIVAGDAPPGAKGWKVSIISLQPLDEKQNDAQFLLLKNQAVSTSGDAEQYVEIGGVRYSHIVDPRTGYGVTGRSNATVIARDGTTTDALATALSVLGPERGMKLIAKLPQTAALMTVKQNGKEQAFRSTRWCSMSRSPSNNRMH